MTVPDGIWVPRTALTDLEAVGRGGEGTVYRVPGRSDSFGYPLAYKEYHPAQAAVLDVETLAKFPQFCRSLASATARWLFRRAAWPSSVVESEPGSRVAVGVLMPLAPEEFVAVLRRAGGGAMTIPAKLELLLNGEDFARRVNLLASPPAKLQLLLDAAETLAFLHSSGVTVGDLSCQNVLFRLHPTPACMLIDCDSMAWEGVSALPSGETPEWELPPGEHTGTAAADNYKLGLLALRLHTGAQHHRDPGRLPAAMEPDLRQLIRRTLATDPVERPLTTEWTAPLRRAIESAPATADPSGGLGLESVPVRAGTPLSPPRYLNHAPTAVAKVRPKPAATPLFGNSGLGLRLGGALRWLLFRQAAAPSPKRLLATLAWFCAGVAAMCAVVLSSGIDIRRVGGLVQLALSGLVALMGVIAFTLGTTDPS